MWRDPKPQLNNDLFCFGLILGFVVVVVVF
jgi:hypothetical protein